MKKQAHKIVLILVLLLLIPSESFSQVRFGIKGSVQRTNISKVHRDSKGRTAGSLGVLAQIPIGYDNQFFFQPEISYSLQGEKDKGNTWGIERDAEYFQNYINVPLYFRAYFSEADSEFFADLGPQIGFLVYQKEKEKDEKNYSKPESIDITIGAGIGYSFLRKYEVSIRYNYGLMDLYKNEPGQQRSSNLALTLAYVFD